jgi:hypothetical protein
MRRIVFYSWQSDLPNATNRGFIQTALENAAAAIAADDTIAVEPVVDRDTQGVAGSPDIASTIFAKITAADIFVADISIVARPAQGRPTPNPNVLIELGYAFKTLGFERVILAFNKAFGKIEELPFDLRMRRVMAYDMPLDAPERAKERKKLEAQLEDALRAAAEHIPAANDEPSPIPAVAAIESAERNRIIVLRRDLEGLFNKLEALEPKKFSQGGTVEELIGALDKTQEPVAEFSKITEMISLMDDGDAALEIVRWFGKIFERYSLPEGFSGKYIEADQDYFKFIGYELFVTLVAFLLREERWVILDRVFNEPIPVRYLQSQHGPGNVYWTYASEYVRSLEAESAKRRRMCFHADLLQLRHTTGGLSGVMPFEAFVAADFFLFLRAELPPQQATSASHAWRAWSCVFLNRCPMFILSAERKVTAERIANALNVPSISELQRRLAERGPSVHTLFERGIFRGFPISKEVIERIGTR